MASFQTLPGFRECYPEDLALRSHLFRRWRQAAGVFGFAEYDAPVLEPLDLYRAKSGSEIEAQLFSFTDKGGREVALRPEMTPTVCRLVGARANTLRRPIKWFSIGEFFRYERMQKGRGRCFHQFNADIFGEAGPEAEIELIALLVQCFAAFGLTADDFYIRLSDRNLWFYYLEALGLDEPRARTVLTVVDRYEKNGDAAFTAYTDAFGPLPEDLKARILAFLGVKSLPALEAMLAPLGAEKLAARLAEWRQVLTALDAMGWGSFVTVDLGVVRGLAYYTGFVFEAFDRRGDLRALAGGGRYDNLVKKLGGPDLPAVGFAIGDMTFSLLLEQRGLLPPLVSAPDVYCVIGGAAERLMAFREIHALRAAGVRVEYPLRDLAFGKQFKAAAESGARLALILGGDELARGVVKVRNLGQRSEVEVPRDAVVAHVRDFLAGNG
ncbi:MAG: histidine--tRNA ligase [Verrucomicrobia bacterium]|nr:histidine--tRNA ligase [Verrucomicrobiota bacterium]